MKINILLTFDYELPLGGVESYSRGLFEPTQNLLSLANQLNVPIVLFADICSAIRFKEWDVSYYNMFKSQLHSALKDKHDVQLHIHPHWMDSKFEDHKVIPSPKYGLSDFKDDSNFSIDEIIRLSFEEMNVMCSEIDKKYKCIAFRAGGYNVEPESKIILNSLYNLGIRYESSVIKGLYQNYSFSKIDFRKSPSTSSWNISKDGPLNTVSTSSEYLTEYPITSMPNTFLNIFKRRLNKIRNKQEIKFRKYNNSGKGYSAVSKQLSLISKIKMVMNPIVLTLDRDYITLNNLNKIVDYNVKKHKNEKEIFLTLISHPKSMGEYHLNLMKDFVLSMKKKYADDLSFITYQNI